MSEDLTAAQARLLRRIALESRCVFNGRARRMIATLERGGFVVADWDLHPSARAWSEKITVWPTERGIRKLLVIDPSVISLRGLLVERPTRGVPDAS